VYLSRYGENSFVPLAPLTEKLEKFDQHRFMIYTDQEPPAQIGSNIAIRRPDRAAFTADLAIAAGVICTAGHTLLSEAIHLGKPVLTVPLATFDQHLCAQVVGQARIGLGLDDPTGISPDHLTEFLSSLDAYRQNMTSDFLLRAEDESVVDTICTRSLAMASH
jgi:uncharacterized protein (TIGR00661 family)